MPRRTIRLTAAIDEQINSAAKLRGYSSPSAFLRATIKEELGERAEGSGASAEQIVGSIRDIRLDIRRLERVQQALFALLDSLAKAFLTCVPEPRGAALEIALAEARNRHARLLTNAGYAIHAGIIVHNRALEDTFYRDLLGFRPYWFGGMTESKVEWVSQQLPDSHDWLEYMVNNNPDISAHDMGVLDHFSIGENSVDMAYKILKGSNRLVGVTADGETKIGRDGKGQFNLYDPDGVRVELMNFHATEKPCCSPFTADDPEE